MDILTWQVNNSHTGVNPTEQVLTPGFVSGSGNMTCLFAEQVDGQVNAQPLYLTSATSSKLPGSFPDGAAHNAVYVATQNGTVYAIDGDRVSDGCNNVNTNFLWKMPLVNYPNGPTPNGVAESYEDIKGAADITPLLGLTETPVIDPATGTLYVVVTVKDVQDLGSTAPFAQVLYALNVKTGAVKGFTVINTEFNGDYTAEPCVAGTTCDTVTPSGPGKIPFVPEHQHVRSSLTLDSAHSTIYIAEASHNDQTPYWGIVLGYNVSNPANMTLQGQFNSETVGTGEEGGIWMGGASPALDPNTNQLFVATGNGGFSNTTTSPNSQGFDLAMSMISLSTDPSTIVNFNNEPEMQVPFPAAGATGPFTWFTPSQWNTFNNGDRDLGSGGLLLLPPMVDGSGESRNLMIGGGKAGVMYLLDRTNLGGNLTTTQDPNGNNANAVQQIIEPNAGIFNTPTFFNGNIYYGASQAVHQRAVSFDAATNQFVSSNEIMSTQGSPQFTSGNFISASSPTQNGVVWQVSNGIFAWNANNVTNAIFSSAASLPGGGGQCVSSTWALPIVDNSKVYFSCFQAPTQTGQTTNGAGQTVTFSQPSDNKPGYLFVYGPAPVPTGAPAESPTNLTATANSDSQITLNWSFSGTDNTSFRILRSTGNANNFGTLNTPTPLSSNATSFVDTSVVPNTTYFYTVQATNADGNSLSSPTASATTLGQFEQDGLVAYWNLDEGLTDTASTTALDATGHGHTGTKPAGAEDQAQPTGLINGSWSFHGTHTADNIAVADAPDLDFTSTQSFTLTAWVFCNNVAGDPDGEHPGESSIVVKSADQGALYGLYINGAGNWVARGPAGDLVGSQASEDSWTHLALVQDGVKGTRTLYVNGVPQPNTAPAQNANGQGQLWIAEQNAVTSTGAPDPNGVDGFAGNLDEIRVYSRALSQSDIQGLMGDPILQANSLMPSGGQTLAVPLFPSPVALTEPRVPANNGKAYNIQVQFAAPLTATPQVVLQGQPGVASVTGHVGTPTLDSTQTILTVPLTGVANAQALDLHLTNLSTSLTANEVEDIPFNVLYGDVSQDNQVNAFDSSAVTAHETGAVNLTNAIFDLNGDGVIDANDVAVVTQNVGTPFTPAGDTNLAFFHKAAATSVNGGNVAANAFDNNVNDNWESEHANSVVPNNTPNTGVPGVDPSFLLVDLGAPATVDGFSIQWGGSAGQVYTIDACTGSVNTTTGTCSSGWQTMVTENNGQNNELKSYMNLTPVTAEFFRMNGTVRVNAAFGYQVDEFYVYGSFTPGSNNQQPVAPVINSPLTETATLNQPFTYTPTSNQTVTFTASNLPGGLSFNGTVISGTPTATGIFNIPLTATNTATGLVGTATLTLTVNLPGPSITSPLTATATVGQPFSYTITANQTSTFSASNLPAGLSLSGAVISGTPTASGTSTITLSATNSTGQTSTAALSLVVNPVVAPPAAPTGLTPTAVSASQIDLTWTASATAGVSYTVFRSTSSGFTPSAATQVAANLTTTTFADTGLTAGTAFFYVVAAVNGNGTTLSQQATAATLSASSSNDVVAIDAGSATGVNNFVGETPFVAGGNDDAPNQPVTIPSALASMAAPEAVYETAHQGGSFTYTIPTPNAGPYTVVLHFAELFFNAPHMRQFNVSINGTQVLTNFDIFAAAGDANFTAIIQSFPNITATNNQIVITFSSGAFDQPMVNGIEVQNQTGGTTAPAAPTSLTATAVSSGQVSLTWAASMTAGVTYSVFRSTTSGFTPSAATQVAANLTTTSFLDTGLIAATKYYYVVEAANSTGATASQQVSVTTLAASSSPDELAIDAGLASGAVSNFVGETPFVTGGNTDTNNSTITIPQTIAGVAAPMAVYQTAHQGGSTYTIPTETAGPYKVVLHFAELFWTAPGQRQFNVAINGTPVSALQNFDIIGAAGGPLTAVVESVPNVTPVNGQIVITFTNGAFDQPMVNGIEIQPTPNQ